MGWGCLATWGFINGAIGKQSQEGKQRPCPCPHPLPPWPASPGRGHPLPASQWVSHLVWLTGITRGSTAWCDADPGRVQAAPPHPASGLAVMEGEKINHFLFPCFQPFSLCGLAAELNCKSGEPRQSCSQIRAGHKALTRENSKNKSENDLLGLGPPVLANVL